MFLSKFGLPSDSAWQRFGGSVRTTRFTWLAALLTIACNSEGITSSDVDAGEDAGDDAAVFVPETDGGVDYDANFNFDAFASDADFDYDGSGTTLPDAEVVDPGEPPPPTPTPGSYRPTYPAQVRSRCRGDAIPTRNYGGRIALTFDDGPHAEYTPYVLDALRERGLHATFFMNGKQLRTNATRALARRVVSEGHFVGNHSEMHIDLARQATDRVETEVRDTHNRIAALGVTPRYFRYPYGSSNCTTHPIIWRYGYRVIGWSIDSADWCYGDAVDGVGTCTAAAHPNFGTPPASRQHDMIGYILDQAAANNGGLLLMHDVQGLTATVLPTLLDVLARRGYRFVTLDDPLFSDLNESRYAVGGSCAAETAVFDCGFNPSAYCYMHQGNQRGYCTMPCEGTCPDAPNQSTTFCTATNPSVTSGMTMGHCAVVPDARNRQCQDIVRTASAPAARFVGQSGATASSRNVCAPR